MKLAWPYDSEPPARSTISIQQVLSPVKALRCQDRQGVVTLYGTHGDTSGIRGVDVSPEPLEFVFDEIDRGTCASATTVEHVRQFFNRP